MQHIDPAQPHERQERVSPALIVFLLFPLFGIVAAIAVALANPAQPGPGPAVTLVEQSPPRLMNWEAPDFELQDLKGSAVRLSALRGRPVFVNFWASWCAPCVEELPAFQTFAAQQGADGAVVLAVNAEEPADVIERFLADNRIEQLTVLVDSEAAARKAYGVINLPTTYIIDPAGMVRYLKLGAMTLDEMNEYLRLALG